MEASDGSPPAKEDASKGDSDTQQSSEAQGDMPKRKKKEKNG